MMKTCATCKYWNTDTRMDHIVEGVEGTCGRIGYKDGCIYPDNLPTGELAQVQTTYDYSHSFLQTNAAFGCVLHEDRVADATGDVS